MKILYFVKKIKNYLISNIRQYTLNKKKLGRKFAMIEFKSDLANYIPMINKKNINLEIEQFITSYLETNYIHIIKKYQNQEKNYNKEGKKIIWVFWYQGIENAPTLVKKCINSIKKYKGDYEVVILNKDDIKNYVEIPKSILKKVDNKTIKLAHFSDILRFSLLSKYGGIWIDSTCYVYNYLFKKFDNVTFNTAVNNKNKWTGFLIGGKPNIFFDFIKELLCEYYSKEDYLIDYFLLDYVIKVAYKNCKECKNIIESANIDSTNIHFLDKVFNEIYNKKDYENNVLKSNFQKLTYKKKYNEYRNKQITYYGYFNKNNS